MLFSEFELPELLACRDSNKIVGILQELIKKPLWCQNDAVREAIPELVNSEDIAVRFWAKKVAGLIQIENVEQDNQEFIAESTQSSEVSIEVLYQKLATVKSSYILMDVIKKIIESKDSASKTSLVEFLQNCEDPIVISYLTKQLGLNFPEESLLPVLAKFLAHSDTRVIANTIEGIAGIKSPQSVVLVSQLLNHTNHRIRANAVVALANQDKETAVKTIERMLQMHEKPHFVIAGLFAISELKLADFFPHVCELLLNDLICSDAEKCISKLASPETEDEFKSIANMISPEIGSKVEDIFRNAFEAKVKKAAPRTKISQKPKKSFIKRIWDSFREFVSRTIFWTKVAVVLFVVTFLSVLYIRFYLHQETQQIKFISSFKKVKQASLTITDEKRIDLEKIAMGKELEKLFSGIPKFENWKGKVKYVSKIPETELYSVCISLEMPDWKNENSETTEIELRTWKNPFSDVIDKTLLQPEPGRFQILPVLKPGDMVETSGYFIPDKNYFLKEGTLNPKESLVQPSFIVRFEKVEKMK